MRPGQMARALRPLERRIANLAGRAQVQRVDDSTAIQLAEVEILLGEARARLERIQQYGLTSVPLDGAYPALVLAPYGDRTQAQLVAVDDDRYRPRGLAAGDVVLYDHRGNRMHFKATQIEVTAVAGMLISVVGDATISVTGSVEIEAGGNVRVEAGSEVQLGGAGGAQVARVGDHVNVGSGSSAGLWPIVEGSTKVKAT